MQMFSVKNAVKGLVPRRLAVYKLRPAPTPSVLLTFDDGPNEVITPKVLAILKMHKARAMFFVIGEQALRYPDLLRQIVNEGHWIGNHSFSHQKPAGRSFAELKNDFLRCQDGVSSIIGTFPRYFRPPLGWVTLNTLAASMSLDLRMMLWSNGGGEWSFRHNETAKTISDGVLTSLTDRQILMLHDNHTIVPEILERSLPRISERYSVNQDIESVI